MHKEICFSVPSLSERSGITNVVANIANALCKTRKYNITVLSVANSRDKAISLDNNIRVIDIGAKTDGNKIVYLIQVVLGIRNIIRNYKSVT